MRVVPPTSPAAHTFDVIGIPLSVVFADGDAMAAARAGKKTLALEPPFHVSDSNSYLIVPVDLGLELLEIFRDGDVDLVHELSRDSLVATGSVEKEGKGKMSLSIDRAESLAAVLAKSTKHGATVRGSNVKAIVESTNKLPVAAVTVGSALLDEDGLVSMLQAREYVGESWSSADGTSAEKLGVEPTYAWSKRMPDGQVGIQLALFSEYDELVALIRPVAFAPA